MQAGYRLVLCLAATLVWPKHSQRPTHPPPSTPQHLIPTASFSFIQITHPPTHPPQQEDSTSKPAIASSSASPPPWWPKQESKTSTTTTYQSWAYR